MAIEFDAAEYAIIHGGTYDEFSLHFYNVLSGAKYFTDLGSKKESSKALELAQRVLNKWETI